jgi:hypothetical protein
LTYTVGIINRPGEKSAVDRYFTDDAGKRVSGWFVIVEARDARGGEVRVPIENRETGKTQDVSKWGEQVPAEVYERLKADKQADGVLDERAFGEKHRGERRLEVTLKGADGKPITRGGQITQW